MMGITIRMAIKIARASPDIITQSTTINEATGVDLIIVIKGSIIALNNEELWHRIAIIIPKQIPSDKPATTLSRLRPTDKRKLSFIKRSLSAESVSGTEAKRNLFPIQTAHSCQSPIQNAMGRRHFSRKRLRRPKKRDRLFFIVEIVGRNCNSYGVIEGNERVLHILAFYVADSFTKIFKSLGGGGSCAHYVSFHYIICGR